MPCSVSSVPVRCWPTFILANAQLTASLWEAPFGSALGLLLQAEFRLRIPGLMFDAGDEEMTGNRA